MKLKITHYVIIIFMLWLSEAAAFADEIKRNNEFLSGYITSVLERELGWKRRSYRLEIKEGIATITLLNTTKKQQKEIIDHLNNIDTLQGINIVLVTTIEEMTSEETTIKSKIYETTLTSVPLPAGELFQPLLADPKEPHFFLSYRYYDTQIDKVNVIAVGFGENFGFYRLVGNQSGDGLQVGLSGGIFSQFNLDAPSFDLINTDYIIGIPVTYRRGPFSTRLRFYHQSSHLGDEFLLRAQPERVEVSYEVIELMLSYDWSRWRGYAGSEYIFRHSPENLKAGLLHGGIEYRGSTKFFDVGRLVGGLDLKSYQEHNWSVDVSLKAGFEFGSLTPGRRHLRLMAEVYKGFAPHGQFYTDKISYYGIGFSLGF